MLAGQVKIAAHLEIQPLNDIIYGEPGYIWNEYMQS